MPTISTIKIHPAIGIARVGNSPTEFFIGPESPGNRRRPAGGYKDAQRRIKRQAARFRLFGYDKNGKLVGEITAAQASITWTVRLANKKSAWRQFRGLARNAPWRNKNVTDRNSLIIDPGPRSLQAPNQAAAFDTGKFMGTTVPLGEIRTDERGRLLVLGGFGHSASPTNAPIKTWANNDGWHDDVSDGPVTATVSLKAGGGPIEAAGAWVIVGPPDFAPSIDNVITLYDVLVQVAVEKLGLKLPVKPSFTNDIYPILRRVMNLRWVTALAGSAHNFFSKVIPPPGAADVRAAILQHIKNPHTGRGGDMPMIWSDHYVRHKKRSQPLTKTQFDILKKWKRGKFINDWKRSSAHANQITPYGLDRAALESCVGGPLHPGIEAGWLLRDEFAYDEPFRLSHTSLEAGDVTKQMSVPWQTDFYDCKFEQPLAWWPAQRPDDVFVKSGGRQVAWVRGVKNRKEMVKKWPRLGFVVKKGAIFQETERTR
jgi:hypothetical protein